MLQGLGVSNYIISKELADDAASLPYVEGVAQLPAHEADRIRRAAAALDLWGTLPWSGRLRAIGALWALRGRTSQSRLELWRRAVAPLRWSSVRIAHAHFGYLGRDALPLRRTGTVPRLITSFHGYDMSGYLAQFGDDVYDDLFAVGDLFLPVSERWAERLVELGCPAERVVVHRMGIDLARFPFWPERGSQAHHPVRLLSVGRLVDKKGFGDGIRAVSGLANEGFDVRYRIVGDGPLEDELRRQSARLRVADRTEFVGRRTHDDVIREMGSADVLLVPSRTGEDSDMEGIPMVAMEAMAVGLPVVATDHSGIGELVRHRSTGMLSREGDPGSLAGAISDLLTGEVNVEELTTSARRYVEANHDAHELGRRLLDLYEGLLR